MPPNTGRLNPGIEYQFKVITYTAFSLCENTDVEDFLIYTNREEVPGFDDIIAKVWYKSRPSPFVYLGQIKHRADKVNLNNKANSISKYRDDMKEIFHKKKSNPFLKELLGNVPEENIEFWFFCSKSIQNTKNNPIEVDGIKYVVKPNNTYIPIFIFAKGAGCYKLIPDDTTTDSRDFDMLHLLLDQPDNKKINEHIQKCDEEMFTKETITQIIAYIAEYLQTPLGSRGLRKYVFELQLLRLSLSLVTIPPTEAYDIYDDLACLWNKLNLEFDVTIVDQGAVDMKPYLFGTLFKVLKNILNFTEFNWNMCISNSNKLPETFNFNRFKEVTKRDKAYHWLSKPDVLDVLLVELWKCDYMPLILSSDCNISTLKKYKHLKKKFIVLDNDYRLSNEIRSSGLSVCANMGDIKNDSLGRELFEGIEISLQGREPVKFVNVVDNHKNIMSEIRCSHLLNLLKKNNKIFVQKECLKYGNSLVFIISHDLVSNKEVSDDWKSSLAVSIKSTIQEENVIIKCTTFEVEKHTRQVKNHPNLKDFSTYHLRRYPNDRLEYLKGDTLKIKHFLVDEVGNEIHFHDGKLTPIIGTRLWNEEDQYILRRLRQATIQNSFLNIEEERIIILTGEVDLVKAIIKKEMIEEFSGDIEIQVEKCIKEKRSALLVVENESFDKYWTIFSNYQYPIFHIQVDKGVLKMLKYRNYQNLYPYIAYEGQTFEETTFFEATTGGVNIITGEAGLGKTALLHSLFERYDRHNFVLFCDLPDYINELKEGRKSEFFKKPLKYILSRCEHSLPSNCSLSNEFFNSLCEFHHKTNRLLLIIDSFDEAVRLHRREVLEFLRSVTKCNIQIIISCRTIFESVLINNFEVRPFQMQNLDKDSAAIYLKRRKLTEADINRIPDEFLINPMNLKFQITLSKDIFLISNPSNKFNLYKAVLEKHIERYYSRRRGACYSTYQRKDILNAYKLLALTSIFGKKVIEDLGLNYDDVVEECVGTYKIELGIIIRFDKDGCPVFMHRKFAEFLVVLWVYENVNTISAQGIYRKLLDSDMLDIRRLLDNYVSENLKLHRAILSEDLQLVERLCEQNQEYLQNVDECDRTPLHLAASYCRQQTCIGQISIHNSHGRRGIVNYKILDVILRQMMKAKCDTNRRDLLMKWTWFEYIRENNLFFEIASSHGLSATLDKYLDLEKRNIKESDIDNALSKDYLHLALVLLKYNPMLNKKYFDKILEMSLKSCDLNSILTLIELQNYKNEQFKIFRKICENIHPSSGVRNYVNFRVNGEFTALHLACMYGNLEIVKRLLNAKVGSCRMDKYKNTPLHYGAMQGSSDIVSMLIKHMPDRHTSGGVKYLTLKTPSSVRKKENMNIENSLGMTPLHVASMRGYPNVVHILLQNGANMDSYDKKGNTSLHFATLHKHMTVVELLLENGANIKSKNVDNNTVLHYAAQFGRLDIVDLLLSKEMDVNIRNSNGNTALHNAVIYARMNIVKLLIENGANPNIQNNSSNTALHSAVIAGRTEIVKVLLETGMDVNLKGHKCRTPLHMAAYNGHTDIFRFLLDNCSDVNARDSYDDTPLHCAVQTGNTNIVQVLLQRKTNINSRGRHGDTPLHSAVNFGHTDVFQMLLENGADVNIKNASDHTVLDLASIKGKSDMLRILARTDEKNLRDHKCVTPSSNIIYYEKIKDVHLHSRNKTDLMLKNPSDNTGSEEPVKICKVGILETLTKENAGNNMTDRYGKNVLQSSANLAEDVILETSIENERNGSNVKVLHEAVTEGNIDMIKSFLKRGFDVNLRGFDGNTPLCVAAHNGQAKILEILLESHADFTIRNDDHNTALHLATQNGSIDSLRVLLAKGIDVNLKGVNGNTSLCLAACHGKTNILEILLQNGADYNITNDSNDAALHLAARGGKTEVVEVLLKNGMNVDLKGSGGNTALHLAADTGQMNTLKILLKKGADFSIRNNYNNTPLHLAAQNGKTDIVATLLKMGVGVNLRGCNGNTALCWAACKGQAETLGLLLENGADYNIRNDDEATILHLAALNGKNGIIKVLLKQGIDINLQDSNGNTSLCLAAWKGEADTLRILLENGADPNIRNKDDDTVLHIAALYGRTDIVLILLKKGADIDLAGSDGNTSLIMAACNGHVETLEALFQNGADINAKNDRYNTALHLSLRHEKIQIIEILLKMGVDINLKDAEGNTSLCLAASNGQVEYLETLLQTGADINIRNDKNDAALHLAAQSGHADVIEILLREGDDVNSRGSNGNTPLCWAASEGHKEVLETLLLNGADINIKNDDNNTALHLAACNGKTHIMEALLKKGVDVNLRGYNGNTSLCLAAYNGQNDALLTLLQNGADTNIKNDSNNTALRLASQYGKHEIVKILKGNGLGADAINTESNTASNPIASDDRLEMLGTLSEEEGADVDNQNCGSDTPLHLAAQYGKTDVVKVLLRLGSDINLKGGDGNTSLCWAACKGQTETFKTLLENGADINIRNDYNNTVLHLAALNGKVDIVEILMNTGLDIDARGYNGNTALSLAAYSGQTETLVSLVLNGADIRITNDDNDNALHLAAQYGNAEIVKVLLRNKMDVNLRGAHGDTALCVAACNGQTEVVRILLQSGADPDIKNDAKDNALTLSIKNGKTEVVEVLLNKN